MASRVLTTTRRARSETADGARAGPAPPACCRACWTPGPRAGSARWPSSPSGSWPAPPGVLSPDTLAAPSDILATAWDLITDGQLPDALSVSLRRAALGFAVGVAAALVFGTIAGLSRVGRRAGGPADADGPHAAAVRPGAAVHHLVRHRRDAEDHAGGGGRGDPALPEPDRRAPRHRPRAVRRGRRVPPEPVGAHPRRARSPARCPAPWWGCASRSAWPGWR